MGIKQTLVEPHWNYFLAIERDLDALSRYVEFDERNFGCFSLELARVLLASGAESDVVCGQICKALDKKSKASNINEYRREITKAFPSLPTFTVIVPRFGLELTPWDAWRSSKGVPLWWTAYNKTKHDRSRHYERANLHNVLNAVAGLFVAVVHLYPDRARAGSLVPSPYLLRPAEDRSDGVTDFGNDVGFNYLI